VLTTRRVVKGMLEVLWDAAQVLFKGSCTKDDVGEIRKLVLTNEECAVPDFSIAPWSQAVLVTPRNAVRVHWNEEALDKLATTTGSVLYYSPAEDTVGNDRTPLSLVQRVNVAALREEKTARLQERIPLAIGMKAMVTLNVATDAELANGSRGEVVVDIILDYREPIRTGVRVHELLYPPAMVVFCPTNTCVCSFPGLPVGHIPVFPCERTFPMREMNGKNKTVTRRQLPITPASAYTDYRSQGQTLETVVVDIGKTPNFGLSPFNAYVALSRSRGRETIRLLRDFDDSIFTQHPNEDLRVEDDRLAKLDQETQEWYTHENGRGPDVIDNIPPL
jgi:hypothetical protein